LAAGSGKARVGLGVPAFEAEVYRGIPTEKINEKDVARGSTDQFCGHESRPRAESVCMGLASCGLAADCCFWAYSFSPLYTF